MYSKTEGGRRGQFFSLDVIAGAFIFMLAFFLLAFYWLNAQALLAQQSQGDLQREAERVSDQLLQPNGMGVDLLTGYARIYSGGKLSPPDNYKVDDVYSLPVASFGESPDWGARPNRLSPIALSHFILMSNLMDADGEKRFYNDMKEKLGIPQYEYYITIEGKDINPAVGKYYLTRCLELLPPSGGTYRPEKGCWAGKPPPAGSAEVANAERIVVFTDYTVKSDGATTAGPAYPAKMRVQIWR